jgi:hypothetical protein
MISPCFNQRLPQTISIQYVAFHTFSGLVALRFTIVDVVDALQHRLFVSLGPITQSGDDDDQMQES